MTTNNEKQYVYAFYNPLMRQENRLLVLPHLNTKLLISRTASDSPEQITDQYFNKSCFKLYNLNKNTKIYIAHDIYKKHCYYIKINIM